MGTKYSVDLALGDESVSGSLTVTGAIHADGYTPSLVE